MHNSLEKQYPVIINEKFYNKANDDISGTLFDMIFHYSCNLLNKKYKKGINPKSIACPYHFMPNQRDDDSIMVSPLGHATCLLVYKDIKIIFDPILNKSSFFFSRFTEAIPKKIIKNIDIIFYSHDHPDHLNIKDYQTIVHNTSGMITFTPKNMDSELPQYSHVTLYSHSWWESQTIFIKNTTITIHCLPAIHWAQSNIWNRNKNLWCSWLISINNKYLFFGGDTAYSEHFKTIAHYFPKIDLAFLSIAPYLPIDMQKESHLDPESAFQAFFDLNQPIFIPIHWGTFAYGDEPIKEPIQKIITLFAEKNCLNKLQCTTLHSTFTL